MEGFNEQVVKRDKTAKSLVIKIVAVVLLFVIPLTLVFLGRFIPYMAMVGLFVFIGGIYVVWWVFTSQKVEYEYSINGDMLNIAKIISLRRRKRVCDINIKDIGYNPVTVDILGIIHVAEGFGIYCKYSPMNVMKSGRGPEYNSISVGLYFF